MTNKLKLSLSSKAMEALSKFENKSGINLFQEPIPKEQEKPYKNNIKSDKTKQFKKKPKKPKKTIASRLTFTLEEQDKFSRKLCHKILSLGYKPRKNEDYQIEDEKLIGQHEFALFIGSVIWGMEEIHKIENIKKEIKYRDIEDYIGKILGLRLKNDYFFNYEEKIYVHADYMRAVVETCCYGITKYKKHLKLLSKEGSVIN